MSQIYIYDNKDYDLAVRNLKTALFDVLSIADANRRVIEEKLLLEKDKKRKDRYIDLYDKHLACSHYNIAIGEELFKNIEELDICNRSIRKLDEEKFATLIASENKNQVTKNVEPVDVAVNEEVVVEEAVPIVEEQVSEEIVQPAYEEVVENTNNEVVYENVDSQSQTIEEVVPTTDEAVNEEKFTMDDFVAVSDGNVVNNDEVISKEVVQEEQAVINEPEINNVVTDLESVYTDSSDKFEIQPEIVDSQVEVTPETEVIAEVQSNVDMKKFKKATDVAAKAIMVGKKQMNNLSSSKKTQEALIMARGSLGSVNINGQATLQESSDIVNTTNDVVPIVTDTENISVNEQELVNAGLLEPVVESKEARIEKLMEQASQLYNEGKKEEAAALYEEISKINSEEATFVK